MPKQEQKEWYLKVMDDLGMTEDEDVFTGTKDQAMARGKEWLQEKLSLDSYQKEILIIDGVTGVHLYQGTFDLLPSGKES